VNLDDAAGRLYWMTFNGNTDLATIETSTLAGDNAQTLIDVYTSFEDPSPWSYSPESIAVDTTAGKIYWTDKGTNVGSIRRANQDGTQAETLLAGLNRPDGLAIDPAAGKMYWIELGLRQIRRANLDGSGAETLVEGLGPTADQLAIDPLGGKIYWNDISGRSLSRADLDGSNVEAIYSSDGVHQYIALAVDPSAGKIYFNRRVPLQSNQIYSANLDGSGEELLINLDPG